MKKILSLILFASMATAAWAGPKKSANIDTLVVTTTPQMHCQGCETKIKQNIRFVKGVKKINTSLQNQKVTVIYDKSKSDYNDFVAAFKKIGYDIKKK
ncbi:MAG: heavy-metal-associated domain-containing protein [Muribaculaceae bacterium]